MYWTTTGAGIASFFISLIVKRYPIDKPVRSKLTPRVAEAIAASTVESDTQDEKTFVAYYITRGGDIIAVDIARG